MLIALIGGESFPTLATHQRSATGAAVADQSSPIQVATSTRRQMIESFDRLPLRFEACGPKASASFLARLNECNIYLTATEAALAWRSRGDAGRLGRGADLGLPRNAGSLNANEQLPGPRRDRAAPRAPHSATDSSLDSSPAASLQMQLVGANLHARLTGEGVPATTTNYFTGNDSTEWRTSVPTYSRVRAKNVYRDIDVIYYGQGRQLEYDFDLAPEADPTAIRLRFSGAQRVWLDPMGDLRIETAAGEIRHHRPFAYQEVNGSRCQVACRFVERQRHEIGFVVGAYDRSRPLVIDPVLELASILQGSNVTGVGLDASGNIYLTGSTSISCLPTTAGVVQPVRAGGLDLFIAKLDPTGTTLLYLTYLGGTEADAANAIAVDAAGNAYVAGSTRSTNFPVTVGALQTAISCSSNYSDAFVAKLNPVGTALLYSTYLGGCLDDYATSIVVDAAGNAYVGGFTASRDFPLRNPLQSRYIGGTCALDDILTTCGDAFVSKLNPAGSALIYSTYLGGSGYDRVNGLALDGAGNLYATGETASPDFPVTAGAFQTVHRSDGQRGDAFVLKLTSTGTALVYSTFLGGSGADAACGIAVSAAGEAYIAGDTSSTDFPVTFEPLQRHNASDNFYKSTDGGNSWSALGGGLPTAPVLASFVIDPTAPDTLYVGLKSEGTVGGRLYKSTNGGHTWQSALSLISGINSLAISGQNPVTIYGAYNTPFGSSLLKSTDGGAHWTFGQVRGPDQPVQIYGLAVDPQNPSTLYALVGVVVSVLRSTDGGNTWLPASNGLQFSNSEPALALDPHNPTTVYANGSHAYRSTDGGQSWARVLGLASFNSIAFAATDASRLYAASNNGIFRSFNGGKKWTQVEGTGLPPLPFSNVQIDPTTPATVYVTASGGGIFKTTDGGATWAAINTGLPQGRTFLYGFLLGIDPHNPATLYARSGDGTDAFVARLNAEGSGLIFSTYLGGSGTDSARAIALDHSGNIYIAGISGSLDYPIKEALQSAVHRRRASSTEAVVTKLSGDGATLAYSTYLGSGEAHALISDAAGNVYVAGSTSSGPAVVASVAAQGFGTCASTFSQSGFGVKITDAPAGLPAPRVLAVTPSSGPSAGGTEITITGSGFLPGAGVRVAGVAADNIQVLSATTIKAITPPAAGQSLFLDVAVINPDGQSHALTEAFTYRLPPIIGRASIVGKDLIVLGSNFDSTGVILLNGVRQATTLRELGTESIVLVGKKIGKRIKVGETVTLQVQNADGQVSAPFSFTRPPQ
ncbi:MAG: SBBP repeat-containing protein [Blastocatellia bacterium]